MGNNKKINDKKPQPNKLKIFPTTINQGIMSKIKSTS